MSVEVLEVEGHLTSPVLIKYGQSSQEKGNLFIISLLFKKWTPIWDYGRIFNNIPSIGANDLHITPIFETY